MLCPYASCNDCCIMHSTSVLILSSLVVVVVGVACCCCILLWLVLLLIQTFAPCACGGCHQQQLMAVVFLPQPLAHTYTPLAHVVVSPIATCAAWCFSFTHWYRYQACTQATTYIFIYCMAGNFDGNLFWWISGFVSNPPIFRLPKLYSVMSSLLHNHSFRV